METVVRKTTNVSLYLLPDITTVIMGGEQMQVGVDPIEFFVSDCNSTNAVLHEHVPEVEGWVSSKFLFDGATWALNPDWIDPATIVKQLVPEEPVPNSLN